MVSPQQRQTSAQIRPEGVVQERQAAVELLPRHLQRSLALALDQRGRSIRGRFAPSPTGVMHRGNRRTALLSWLEVRLQGGEWLLRIDDLDTPRNRPGAEALIMAELRWLGLHWDGPVIRQSERRGLYGSVLSALRRGGWLYPCRCSRRMLADLSAPHGAPAAYPGTCRDLVPAWGTQAGRLPSWRLRRPEGPLTWQETLTPDHRHSDATGGDVVVRRADGFLAYHLATAVDELWLGISTVLRGEDLAGSTAAQVALMASLAAAPPHYCHVPLWCHADGQRLAKRHAGGTDAADAWQGGSGDRDPSAAAREIGRLAASLALVPPGQSLSAQELLQSLDLARFYACLDQGRTDAVAMTTKAQNP